MKFTAKINKGDSLRYGINFDVERIRGRDTDFYEYFLLINIGHKRIWMGFRTKNYK